MRPVNDIFPVYSCSVLSRGVAGFFQEISVDVPDNPVLVTIINHPVRHLLAFDNKQLVKSRVVGANVADVVKRCE